jgi:hypothetical protein
MSIHKSSVRRSGDIRTLAGTVGETFLPHRALLKIACLEMEKFRRTQERESAALRVQAVDQRFAEIAAEQARLFRAVGRGEKPLDQAASAPIGARGIAPASAGGKRKFRY